MSWVKIDDHFDQHPKIVQVSFAAAQTQVAALCYSNRMLTDGFIPAGAAARLVVHDGWWRTGPDGAPVPSTWTAAVEELVAAGIWRPATGGWQIHDFDQYQPTKAEVLAEREAARDQRVAAGRARAATGVRVGGRFAPAATSGTPASHQRDDQRNTSGGTSESPAPIPIPIPDPGSVPVPGPRPESHARAILPTTEYVPRSTALTVTPKPGKMEAALAAYRSSYAEAHGREPASVPEHEFQFFMFWKGLSADDRERLPAALTRYAASADRFTIDQGHSLKEFMRTANKWLSPPQAPAPPPSAREQRLRALIADAKRQEDDAR